MVEDDDVGSWRERGDGGRCGANIECRRWWKAIAVGKAHGGGALAAGGCASMRRRAGGGALEVVMEGEVVVRFFSFPRWFTY